MEYLQGLFSPLVAIFRPILEALYGITVSLGIESYGLAIIMFTALIKLLLHPLTVKQIESSKAMQLLQPRMNELKEKYGHDQKLFQQKMMELYQESGMNPLAGCLPMLIQLPLLMGVYYSLYGLDYSGYPGFLWVPNLSEADPTYILPILSAVSMYVMQKQLMNNQQSSGPNAFMMRYMVLVMPIFIGWISLTFPAGLVLYWITFNVVQIIQQYIIFKDNGKDKAGGKK